MGNVTGVTQVDPYEDDRTVSYDYNKFNLVKSYTDAMGQTETYTYDNYGNLTKKKDRNGNTIENQYDALNRILIEDVNGVANTFTYGKTGGVRTAKNGNVTQDYTYNQYGLVSEEITTMNGCKYSIKRTYDSRGRNTVNLYKKNGVQYKNQHFTYDDLNRVAYMWEETDEVDRGPFSIRINYDNNSNIISFIDSQCERYYEYNEANLLTRLSEESAPISDEFRTDFVYTYSFDGNIIEEKDEIRDRITTYTYDSNNRLKKESTIDPENTDFSNEYSYDAFGNRIYKSYHYDSDQVYDTTYEYDANNRLLKEKESYMIQGNPYSHYNVSEYSYDNNGNRISTAKYVQKISDKFTISLTDANADANTGYDLYSYDSLNQLISYKNEKGENATYTYLPNHYRMSKTVGNVNNTDTETTYHIWDGDNIVSEANESNELLRIYIRGGDKLVSDEDHRSYMYDGHGNIVRQRKGITKENGTNYDAFGNVATGGIRNDVPFSYCGEYTDVETGLIYLRNRYYDTTTGSFITEDTHWNPTNMIYGDKEYEEDEIKYPDITAINQANNLYNYCMENPVKYKDSDGMLSHPGEIHNWVQHQIIAENGMIGKSLSMERWVQYPNGFLGKVDLVDNSNGKIWELKPESVSQQEAEEQLMNYTRGRFLGSDISKYSPTIGGYDGYVFRGFFQKDIYNIEYWYGGNGIIRYSYTVNREELSRQLEAAGQAVTEAAIIAAMAVIAAAAAAAGIPIPLLV